MKLDIDIAKLSGPGRLPVPLSYEIVREVNEADIAALQNIPAGSKAPELKRLSNRHHALARMLASGISQTEAAVALGYSVSRVSILLDSPAFQELHALYKEKKETEFISTFELMAGVSRDALQVLAERLEDTPDRFSVNELTRVSTEFSDRAEGGNQNIATLPTVIELVAPDPSPPPHLPQSDAADTEEVDEPVGTDSTSS